MLQINQVKIDHLEPHPQNVRQGDVGAISESLRIHGQYKPIVVQKSTNRILAGNHTWKAAKSLGWSDIAVTLVDVSDEQALRILLMDNRTTELATNDNEALASLLESLASSEESLEGTGYELDDLDDLLSFLAANNLNDPTNNPNDASAYSGKINVPQYEIVGEEPEVLELFDDTKTARLIKNVESSNAPNDVKEFLKLAAQRHTVFSYRKIAEFFPHQTKEIQQLMIESVLIIIDFEDAMKNGYVKLSERLGEIMTEGDDEE